MQRLLTGSRVQWKHNFVLTSPELLKQKQLDAILHQDIVLSYHLALEDLSQFEVLSVNLDHNTEEWALL